MKTIGTRKVQNFYPRPPRGGRRAGLSDTLGLFLFLSTPSARRATICGHHHGRGRGISIHALREEGDAVRLEPLKIMDAFLSTPSARRATEAAHFGVYALDISIHALREEGDPERASCLFSCSAFLSTPSARRATPHRLHARPVL